MAAVKRALISLSDKTGVVDFARKDDQGNTTEFTATLDYGKQTFKGCAVAGAQEHAPT